MRVQSDVDVDQKDRTAFDAGGRAEVESSPGWLGQKRSAAALSNTRNVTIKQQKKTAKILIKGHTAYRRIEGIDHFVHCRTL